MDADVRDYIIEELAEATVENLRDLDIRWDVAINGFKGLRPLTDAELMDEYLDTYESDEDFRACSFDSDEPTDYESLAYRVTQQPEYTRHWESIEAARKEGLDRG